MSNADPRLVEWRAHFQKTPLAREAVISLAGRAQEIWRRTFDVLRKDSPEYRNAVDDAFTAESKSHCGELLELIVGIAAGKRQGSAPFDFVRRHAEWRARHQVPLVASLHAYRLAHKTYWGISRELLGAQKKQKEALRALTMLSEFWIELFEAVGSALEEAHAAEEARVFAQNTQSHSELIAELLNGAEPSDLESRQLLALCGIRPGMNVTVAIVRRFLPVDGKHVDVEVSTRSLVRLLNQMLATAALGKLVGSRNGEAIVIAGGAGDTSALLARHLVRHGFGRKSAVQAGAGIGLNKKDIAQLPEALAEARIALEMTNPSRATLRFGNIHLTDFLIWGADRAALRLVPDWLREAHSSGRHAELTQTIREFAECSLNVKETARHLGVHPNTVYFRLNQIRSRTGADPRTLAGATLLLTSLRLLDSFRNEYH